MIFYHVSTFKGTKTQQELIPRIPKHTLEHENKTIKRICLSTSIDNCFSGLQYMPDCPFILFKLDIDINDNHLITPRYLYDNNLVMDALETNEYWYTASIKAIGKVYTVLSYDIDFTYAWTCINKSDLLNIIKDIFGDEYNYNLEEENNLEEIYMKAYHLLDKNKKYNLCDELDNKIAELKYATKKKYYNIELAELNTTEI